ncbi:DUF559 domain-containing protein [Rhizobium sullae]|uniref:DUF559 domain-containing protein n=1 Tax=Rhizobium sullae TaxID=50338 RepID=UPI002452B802|nr:DUF559 domain-containing protein [Rhizobium sullae]
MRARKLKDRKFRRQVPLGRCILDFVWLNAKLIVHLDGSQDADNTSNKARDAHFRAHGVLRFWNDEFERNLDFVCLATLDQLRNAGE